MHEWVGVSVNLPRVGRLVSCFGFNGPLRQYFSLYRAVFHREAEKGKMIEERKQECPQASANARLQLLSESSKSKKAITNLKNED